LIKRMNLKNFKCWEDSGDINFSKITGFFGSNSSGKTSIIQSLLMLKQTTESADRNLVLEFGNDKLYVELGTFEEIIFEHNENLNLELEISWTLNKELKIKGPDKSEDSEKFEFSGSEIKFKTKITRKEKTRQLCVEKIEYQFANLNFQLSKNEKSSGYELGLAPKDKFEFKRTRGRPWQLPPPTKCYGFPDEIKSYFQNASFLSDFELKFENLFSNVYYLGPLREYPKRNYTWSGAKPSDMGRKGERVIDALLASKEANIYISRGQRRSRMSVEEYTAFWLKELGLIESFEVKPLKEGGNLYEVWVQKSEGSSSVLLTDVGFGVSQILPVITLCYYVPPNSILIIEQPEIHLHPTVQAGLADVFIDAMKYNEVQIILESHSEHLLRRLQRRIAEEKGVKNNDIALYFCNSKNGKSQLDTLKIDEYGNITNWPKDFFNDDLKEIAAMTEAIFKRKSKGKKR